MNIYQGADKVIKEMNRKNLKAFNLLKLARFDELNVIRRVDATYDASVREAKRKYYEIAVEAYIVALYEARIDRVKAHEMADDTITDMFILGILEDVDPVTLYAFLPETERKKQRLSEALAATSAPAKEIDKALRYWTVQIGQYAITSVDRARLQAFKDAGIEKVKWITQEDERVCYTCGARHERVYPVDNVPPKPHIACRCYLVPVLT